MEKVRIGIIGLGNMGSSHAESFANGAIPNGELAAICDINPDKFANFNDQKYKNVKRFTDSAELLRSGAVDAVIVATPHYFHTTIGIDALNNGIHLCTEKPISVHKADAQRLIDAHKAHPELVFCAMFNQRTDPHYTKMKKIVESGELGTIRRTNWIITNWFRSEAYYRSGGWRATWAGEGGGVLLNQCPHNLDLFQWICGMPIAVTALGALGKYHDIEVEDDVTAMFEYANGATGVFITTTGEAPGTNRLEIIGTRGKLVNDDGKLTYIRNEIPSDEFNRTTSTSFEKPEVWNVDIPVNGNGEQHVGIRKNFVNAILHGEKLIAPAEEGIKSVEMANAMLYSLMTGKRVTLPMNANSYEKHLKKLIETSRFVKKNVVDSTTNLNKYF